MSQRRSGVVVRVLGREEMHGLKETIIGKGTAKQIMRPEDLEEQCREVKYERDITQNTV